MSTSVSLNERFDALKRQHELMFGNGLVPPNCPNLAPMRIKRCSKCQGLGHITSDCPNKEFITLREWEVAMEEENKEKNDVERDDELKDTQEKVMKETREEELLVLGRVLTRQKGVQGEPASPIHTRPLAQTLKPNLCQLIPERLLDSPNSELRAFEEVVQSKSEESPTNTFLISRGKENKRVSKFMRDLFSSLVLFQPKLKQEEEVTT